MFILFYTTIPNNFFAGAKITKNIEMRAESIKMLDKSLKVARQIEKQQLWKWNFSIFAALYCIKYIILDKERNINLDVIRSVAIVFVVLQHCWSMLGYSSTDFGWRSCTSRYGQIGVALFVMVSGALLLSKVHPIGEFFKKRLSRVLIPFGIMGTGVYIISVFTHKYAGIHSGSDAVLSFLPYLFENKINVAYWYIFLILGLYLITPFLQRAIHTANGSDNKQLLHFGLCLWLCASFIETFYPQCEFFQLYSFRADDFIGFFVAGYYLVHYFKNKESYKWVFVLSFLITASLNLFLKSKQIHLPILLNVEILSVFLCLLCLRPSNQFVKRGVIAVSRYSYTIYLIHFVIIALGISIGIGHLPIFIALSLLAVFTLLISMLLCFVIDKCKFINNSLFGIQ